MTYSFHHIISPRVTKATITCIKPPVFTPEVALFVSHSADGLIKPYVHYYLEALKQQQITILFIIASDQPFVMLPPNLVNEVDGLFIRENKGYDFAAWAHILSLYPELFNSSILYLLNDSVVGPTNKQSFSHVIKRIRETTSDIVSLTDNIDEEKTCWHLQSYFLAMKIRALQHKTMQDFMKNIVSFKKKQHVKLHYKIRLSQKLISSDLTYETLFPSLTHANHTLLHWKALLQSGCPFLKTSVIQDRNPLMVDQRGWQTALTHHGYDLSLLETQNRSNLIRSHHSAHIHQIYYHKKQRSFLDHSFTPYDNSNSNAAQLCEYHVFKTLFDLKLHQNKGYLGAISWKFKLKTGLSGQQFLTFINSNPGYDVYFINPFPNEEKFSSVWTQGEFNHPQLIELAQHIFNAIGYNVDLSTIITPPSITAYCNYWVGNEAFWEKYMSFTLPIYYYILFDAPPKMRHILLFKRADKSRPISYFPFILERCFSLLLRMEPSISFLKYHVRKPTESPR